MAKKKKNNVAEGCHKKEMKSLQKALESGQIVQIRNNYPVRFFGSGGRIIAQRACPSIQKKINELLPIWRSITIFKIREKISLSVGQQIEIHGNSVNELFSKLEHGQWRT